MNQFFEKYDISLTDVQKKHFAEFLEIFKNMNSQINLSAIRDDEGIIEKHFVDSILLTKFWDMEGSILDLGTGGGFPGIPLSIVSQEKNAHFTLVDSVGKKVKVVNNFISQLGLKNISAIQGRAEELGHNPEYREKYDIVVSRATAFLPTLIEYTLPFLKLGGIFVSYKLDNQEEIVQSNKALDFLNAEIISEKKYTLAGQERIFLFIQKIGKTPKKYPRKIGEPLSNPIS